MKLKIYTVTFNDGGWYSSGARPSETVVAESKEQAIEKALEKSPQYKSYDKWASEFTIDGYVIELHDKATYERDNNINSIIE